jgi:hypothetical protein
MVMGCLASPQEAAAMWSEPIDEVIVVLEGVNALLHQQCEVTDCQVVVTVPVQQGVQGGAAQTLTGGQIPERLPSRNPTQPQQRERIPAPPVPSLKPPH